MYNCGFSPISLEAFQDILNFNRIFWLFSEPLKSFWNLQNLFRIPGIFLVSSKSFQNLSQCRMFANLLPKILREPLKCPYRTKIRRDNWWNFDLVPKILFAEIICLSKISSAEFLSDKVSRYTAKAIRQVVEIMHDTVRSPRDLWIIQWPIHTSRGQGNKNIWKHQCFRKQAT